jgi:GTP-binding protein Era
MVPVWQSPRRGAVTLGAVHSGFVTLVGRPNVGKSTLVNAVCGTKVSIVSRKPQTTRTRVRGVRHGDGWQVVFVDTPGLHKPVTPLGERVNATALDSVNDVDVVCLVIDATKKFGRGDQWVADRIDIANAFVVVNKIDRVDRAELAVQLHAASVLDAAAYFPVSAATGEGVDALLAALVERMPEGPAYFPPDMVTDVDDQQWVAELVREQLLAVLKDELPYSVATRVTEWEWPRIRCEIYVERESQKGMVIGKGGLLLRDVGTKVRAQLPPGAFIELHVVVDKDWQQRPDRLERLGY